MHLSQIRNLALGKYSCFSHRSPILYLTNSQPGRVKPNSTTNMKVTHGKPCNKWNMLAGTHVVERYIGSSGLLTVGS